MRCLLPLARNARVDPKEEVSPQRAWTETKCFHRVAGCNPIVANRVNSSPSSIGEAGVAASGRPLRLYSSLYRRPVSRESAILNIEYRAVNRKAKINKHCGDTMGNDSIYEIVTRVLIDQFEVRQDAIDIDVTLDDLDVDSVSAVELSDILCEDHGLPPLPDDQVTTSSTIGELCEVLNRARQL
jgi:acyl carrier protein